MRRNGVSGTQQVAEQPAGDRVRQVADQHHRLRELAHQRREVGLQRVREPDLDGRRQLAFGREQGDEAAVDLERQRAARDRRQRARQLAQAGADLERRVARAQLELLDDLRGELRPAQEVLAARLATGRGRARRARAARRLWRAPRAWRPRGCARTPRGRAARPRPRAACRPRPRRSSPRCRCTARSAGSGSRSRARARARPCARAAARWPRARRPARAGRGPSRTSARRAFSTSTSTAASWNEAQRSHTSDSASAPPALASSFAASSATAVLRPENDSSSPGSRSIGRGNAKRSARPRRAARSTSRPPG